MTFAARIVATGLGGFVGRHLAPLLEDRYPGAALTAVVRSDGRPLSPRWESVRLDLADARGVDHLMRQTRPDLVLHFAAQSSVGHAVREAAETWRTNLVASLTLAEAVGRHAPDATVFFTSSGEVYGRAFLAGPVDETSRVEPANAYAWSKVAAEQVLDQVLPRTTRLVVVRAFNHTGPGQDERFALPTFAAQIARIESGATPPVLRCGNLDAERDFLDVRDVVRAYLSLLALTDGPNRLLVNVASGSTYRIGDLLRRLLAFSPARIEIAPDPARMRPSEIPRAAVRVDRIRDLAGWSPAHPVDDMLATLLADWRRRVAG